MYDFIVFVEGGVKVGWLDRTLEAGGGCPAIPWDPLDPRSDIFDGLLSECPLTGAGAGAGAAAEELASAWDPNGP